MLERRPDWAARSVAARYMAGQMASKPGQDGGYRTVWNTRVSGATRD